MTKKVTRDTVNMDFEGVEMVGALDIEHHPHNYYENGDYHRLKDKYHEALSRELKLLVHIVDLERELDDLKNPPNSTRPPRTPGS